MPVKIDAPPLPPALEEERGGGSEWIELVKTPNDIEAHLLTGRLSEAGVETRTVKDRSGPGAWLLGGSDPWAPVTILVPRLQHEDARIVMAEISLEGPPAQRRPVLSPPQARRRAAVWWLSALILGILFTSIALLRTGTALGSCGIPIICGESADTSP